MRDAQSTPQPKERINLPQIPAMPYEFAALAGHGPHSTLYPCSRGIFGKNIPRIAYLTEQARSGVHGLIVELTGLLRVGCRKGPAARQGTETAHTHREPAGTVRHDAKLRRRLRQAGALKELLKHPGLSSEHPAADLEHRLRREALSLMEKIHFKVSSPRKF